MNNVRVVPVAQVASDSGGFGGPLAPLAAVSFGSSTNLLALLSVNIQALGSGGFLPITSGDDSTDSVVPDAGDNKLFSIARLTGYDAAGDNWDRVRVSPDNADGLTANALGALVAAARGQVFNGATYDRARSGSASVLSGFSALGSQLVSSPGEWTVEHRPAAATVASATRAAGAAGVRNVCRSITASLVAIAAQGQVDVVVRDGAAGAGTILWSARFALLLGTSDRIALSGLNIVGSPATAMTIEFLAAPAATNFEGVAMTGCLAS